MVDPRKWHGLKWRCIGPPRGGRVVAVAGHPTDDRVHYFGGCAGGVWKTADGGTFWENISDGYFNTAAVGALAVSESDPNVIYAGTGEATIRGDVSYGDGMYKSTDGGQTWVNIGLPETHHIAEIRIHPQDPDLVYVAAQGHAFGPNEERGVYRSKDGGQSWEKVLFRSDKAGAADLAMDVTNPRILYATMWEAYRHFWTLSSGGPDSSIYKSTDGGDTWVELTHNPGLPDGTLGKMGVTVSPAMPNRVWAIIEAENEKAGVYRSDDGGATWSQLTSDRKLIARPWYYCHIFADPQDADTVYVTNLQMWKSTDGGRLWDQITTPHGDNHDLWIDPRNPQHMVEGNDGGACVTYNGGVTWSTIYNQMTSQFYHLDVDNQYPFRVYGTQQDNSSISVPSSTEWGCIPWNTAYAAGTGESGYIAVKPDDTDIVYVGAVGSSPGGGGALQKYNHRTKQLRLVTVYPEMYSGHNPKDLKYRFAWTFPIVFSPHDPDILYTTGNHVFRTKNGGQSWEEISPDLTRAEEETMMASGGPLTLDTSGAEHYATIFAFAECPHDAGVFWAGSDDGLMHISRDNGATWTDITPADLPERTLISLIELSVHEPGTAFVAATRYKLDDYEPYLYKTDDYGATWEKLAFPAGKITRVVRQDPVNQELLYVGSEDGLYLSFNGGVAWAKMGGNLPVVPIYDMKVKDDALVVATHGRSFWILDDLTPMRQMPMHIGTVHLFSPKDTVRLWLQFFVGIFDSEAGKNYMLALGAHATGDPRKQENGKVENVMLDAGENPPRGVEIYYIIQEESDEPLIITILDNDGNEVNSYRSDSDKPGRPLVKWGINRFVWDMRYPRSTAIPDAPLSDIPFSGPFAVPGTYYVKIEFAGHEQTVHFDLLPDPRIDTTAEEFHAQFVLWSAIRDKLSAVNEGLIQLRQVRSKVQTWVEWAGDKHETVQSGGKGLIDKLNAIEGELTQVEAKGRHDRLRMPAKLDAKLANLFSIVGCVDEAPTTQGQQAFDDLGALVDVQLSALDEIMANDVGVFNSLVAEAALPAIGA